MHSTRSMRSAAGSRTLSRPGTSDPTTTITALPRPRTTPGALPTFAFTPLPSFSKAPAAVSPGPRAFRPARSSASSSRVHGTWSATVPSGAWSASGTSVMSTTSPRPAPFTAGPRISEPVRLDPPARWGAPPRRRAGGATRPQKPGATRGTHKIGDFAMLAAACRRGGRLMEEAVAQYCSGVLLENSGQRAKARDCYTRMLAAAQACPDDEASRAARAVGHNCLGVCLQALGDHSLARSHHQEQLALADQPGKFVGHLNLGLVQSSMGEMEEAAISYRHALRCAIRAGSLQGEAVACGNLALVGKESGDLETARACLDRYLQLTEELSDAAGVVEAHHRLGGLMTALGDLHEAGSHFESALHITSAQPEAQAALNATKIEIGLAQGSLEFSEWMTTGIQAGF